MYIENKDNYEKALLILRRANQYLDHGDNPSAAYTFGYFYGFTNSDRAILDEWRGNLDWQSGFEDGIGDRKEDQRP